jgi:hypothetical protein
MPHYGIVGETRYEMCARHLAPAGAIEMFEAQPTPAHAASPDGTWMLPPTARIAEIDAELMRLDLEAVRPLRAKVAGNGTPEDDARLADIETQAQALRGERAGLAPV